MRIWLLFLGAIAAVGFAAIVLIALPNALFRQMTPPQGLAPYTQSESRGRAIYVANGCIYCHSQQVRDNTFTTDVLRGWGERPSVPSDFIYDRPHLVGTMRTGPDLMNVGERIPDRNWHLIHLYDPRAVVKWSIMPNFPFLFELKDSADVRPGDHVVPVAGRKMVVATADALALVDYLVSLKRSSYPVPSEEQGRAAGARGQSAHSP